MFEPFVMLHLVFVTLLLFPIPGHESRLPLFPTRTISEPGVMSHVPHHVVSQLMRHAGYLHYKARLTCRTLIFSGIMP